MTCGLLDRKVLRLDWAGLSCPGSSVVAETIDTLQKKRTKPRVSSMRRLAKWLECPVHCLEEALSNQEYLLQSHLVGALQ